MKFYGHADLHQNELQNAALTTLTTFPSTPVVGQLVFVNSVVYICVTAGELPVWVPLTREITAYTHSQPVAATTWNITHDLNTTSVNVQVYDNTSKVMIPSDIQTLGNNDVQITFNNAQAGRAVLVSGHFDGLTKPTYAYTHYQNSASTSWTIQHNLGYNPIVRVFVGNQEVQPTTITFTNSNQVVVTFATAQVGYAQLI
jgi:hypothetical protein